MFQKTMLLSYVIVSSLEMELCIFILLLFCVVAGNKAPSLSQYPIRLVDGVTPYGGRVEILYKGVWGTVCWGNSDIRWGFAESHVVCRQLGFGPALTGRVKQTLFFMYLYTTAIAVFCPLIASYGFVIF